MSRTYRLTRRAEESLAGIARWTIKTFGTLQAEVYEEEIIARCNAIVDGTVHSRSCSVIFDNAQDLRYVRAGEHFLIFLEQSEEIIVVDILHSRSDLPRHIARLAALKGENF